jgi:hypothetical protein
MRFKDLPEDSANGQPQMMCREGHGPFSAQRGDYFWAEPEDPVQCECGSEMVLVREIHYFERV